MRAHIIENGVVTNTIEVDSLDIIHGLIDAELGGTIGDLWDGVTFTTPAPAPKSKAEILMELATGDQKIIRAVLEGDTGRIEAWNIKATELRAQL